MAEVSVNVRCSGRMHKISIMPDGAFVLHNHTKAEIAAERILAALGGGLCRCVQVLDAWRQQSYAKLPQALQPSMNAAMVRWGRRRHQRSADNQDRLQIPIKTRVETRITQMVYNALEQCDYRRSRSRWAGGNHIIKVSVAEPNVESNLFGHSIKVWSENSRYSGTDSFVYARIPQGWYSRVYKRGLAIIDGVFVLDVLNANDDGTICVLAGYQSIGYEITTRRATFSIASDGNKIIRFD